MLQVVGRFNRWLKIDRNGTAVWMADWVPYTRVADSEQTRTETQSQIDNCCFVDRQCSADADWVSGYWAFQQGQCPVPEQTQQQTPLQTSTTDSSQANNCCYTGWQCTSDADWERGYHAFAMDHCDVPPGLIIEGPDHFVALMKEVLRYLESKSPAWYAYAHRGLDKIRLVEGSGISSVRTRSRTWSMSPDQAFISPDVQNVSPPYGLAAVMVHEACHVHRHEAGLQPGGYEGEKACLAAQLEAAKTFGLPDYVYKLQHSLDNIDDPFYQWWH